MGVLNCGMGRGARRMWLLRPHTGRFFPHWCALAEVSYLVCCQVNFDIRFRRQKRSRTVGCSRTPSGRMGQSARKGPSPLMRANGHVSLLPGPSFSGIDILLSLVAL